MPGLWKTVVLNLVFFFPSKPWFLPHHKYFSSCPMECCDIHKTQLPLKFISNENRSLCQATCVKVQGRKSSARPDAGSPRHISHGRRVRGEGPRQIRACALLARWARDPLVSDCACAGWQVVLPRGVPLLPSLLRTRASPTPGGTGVGAGKQNEGELW